MNAITLEAIAKITEGQLTGNKYASIKNIIFDSRTIISDEETLFIAFTSSRNNGHSYIEELYFKGIRNFMITESAEKYRQYKRANFIQVENSLESLQKLAKTYRNNYKNNITAITGSNGKTVVKEWLFQLLHKEKSVIRSPKSFNSQIGVPLSLLLLDNKYDTAIIEAGISFPGEMQKLEEMIKPSIGIITNIGNAHSKNFNSQRLKIAEKLKLFEESELIIYCKDYEKIDLEINKKYSNSKKLFSWSKKEKADLEVLSTDFMQNSTEILTIHKGEKHNITIPFTDSASIENAISCLAYLVATNQAKEKIKKLFKTLLPVEMRLELKQGINNCSIINDYYNSDMSSLRIALDFLSIQNQHNNKSIILSDIIQSGEEKNELYRKISELIIKSGVKKVVGIGKNLSLRKNLFSEVAEKAFFLNTDDFINSAFINNFNNETILIKGSRKFELEKISEKLMQKKHRTVLEINLSALTNNLNYYKSLLLPGTKIMVMVKAFSYGSGSYEIANLLQEQNVDYLGVAFADEGVALRKAGISMPIIVMNPEQSSFSNIVDFKLEPEIYNFKILREYAKFVKTQPGFVSNIHIKTDTGMKRLGFCEFETEQLIQELKQYGELRIKSIFSHLAGSDEEIHDDFTESQIEKFKKISTEIIREFDYKITRHILNSSGIERFPGAQFEMVRLGIGLYGFSPNNSEKLQNVSTLKSTILQIKKVKKGETIGYSRKTLAERDMITAVVPVGYADGLSRALSNGKGKVLINNKFAKIQGNVCMDMFIAEITDIECIEGDEVIIFGDKYPATEIAEILNTIPYEIITSVSERVKRIYFKD